MNGIKMNDCKFYVDKDARTVVCVIPRTRDMVLDFMCEHFRWGNVDFWAASCYNLDQKLRMPNSFVGKAVCADEDEWNEEIGRTIAFTRAKDKCYKSFFKRANLMVQAIDQRLGDAITMFNDLGVSLTVKQHELNDSFTEKYNFSLLDDNEQVIY